MIRALTIQCTAGAVMSPRERQKARVFNLEGSDGKGFPRSDSEEKKDAWHKQKTRPMNRAFLACGNFDRAGLEARFLSAWSRSDQLFHLIKDSEMLVRPIVWRHPLIFYVGHLPAFTWNQIGRGISTGNRLIPISMIFFVGAWIPMLIPVNVIGIPTCRMCGRVSDKWRLIGTRFERRSWNPSISCHGSLPVTSWFRMEELSRWFSSTSICIKKHCCT